MGKAILEVRSVYKSFKLPIEQANGIKQAFINFTKGIKGYKKQEVLNDINFKVEKGDFFGIVGRNGSGKSTLLKLISGIYTPDSGSITVNGKLVSFIELGVGFNPELTGRENVYLNGALLGFTKDEVEGMYNEIVEFAELGDFMDQKLKNYSSGMQVRLAFSIAIKAQGDILVLDEVLAVGDEAFQRKCYQYFQKLKHDKKTVILVTHDMNAVREHCNKAILIDNGKITARSSANKAEAVADKYSELFMADNSDNSKPKTYKGKERLGIGNVVYENINHKLTSSELKVSFTVVNKTNEIIKGLNVCLDFYHDSKLVTGTCYDFKKREGLTLKPNESKKMTVTLPNHFGKHEYNVNMGIYLDGGHTTCDLIKNAIEFNNGFGRTKFFKVFVVTDFNEE